MATLPGTGRLGQQSAPTPMVTPLSPYLLDGVEDLDEVIGHGSYAVVKKLKFRGLECVGKKMHDILYLNATPQQREDMLTRFQGECELLMRLPHPCIVQFMGVYFEEGTPLPVLVMEHLHSTLAATIDRYGVLPDQISYGILCDVSLGLRYLHEHSPPIIHRDLSANNILLTSHMNGKISDLGVAKMLNLSPAQMTQLVQTKAPGTPCYMPPEALSYQPKYNTKIDIYSMGVMLIHVFCGEWPLPTDAFQPDPRNPDSMVPVTEVERRAEFLRRIGDDHPLISLMRSCLSNNLTVRPDAAQINMRLTEIKGHLPAMANTRIELVRQLQSSHDETVAVRKVLQENRKSLKRETKYRRLSHRYSADLTNPSLPKMKELLHPQFKLQWKRGADMPVEITEAQAVAIGDEVYVGGKPSGDIRCVIVKYSVTKDEWTHLPDHSMIAVGFCQFQGELYSVGGWCLEGQSSTNKVYRYSTQDKKWVESLNPMLTKRGDVAVLTTTSAIIACGGDMVGEDGNIEILETVEVYCSTTSQWHTADPLPEPCTAMSSVTISGSGYLLGGSQKRIRSAFCVDMATLVDRATSLTGDRDSTSTWKTLPDTPLTGSAAATLSGGLLAVGGRIKGIGVQSAVHVFITSTNSWVKLPFSNLPSERYVCVSVQLPNDRVMVIGGMDKDKNHTSTCYLSCIQVSEPDWAPQYYLEKVQTIYDFTKVEDGELTFTEGAIIYVVEKLENGWWKGVLDGGTGYFPSNFVRTVS